MGGSLGWGKVAEDEESGGRRSASEQVNLEEESESKGRIIYFLRRKGEEML